MLSEYRQNNRQSLRCIKWGFALLISLLGNLLNAQLSFEKLENSIKTQQKYIVMNISSRSCMYCLMQQKRIEKSETLKNRLNNEFYYLHWTVENVGAFQFNGKYFRNGDTFIETYGKDETGFIAYPLWLIFDKNNTVIYRFFGIITNEKIEKLLNILSKAAQEN